MKTLDEVINNFEICRKARLNIRSCDGCTYADDNDVVCINCNETDALYYLKEYKERQEMLRCWNEKAISEQQNIADAYMLYKIASEKEKENLPLTWDELKGMEGKPVWILADGKGRWRIVREVSESLLITESGLPLHKCWIDKSDGWQAYRKERK